jgi:hypothetical protein
MRTQLLTLAATLTLVGFATTSVATTTGAAAGGGGSSGGGVSAPSGGGGSSSGSGGGSSGSSGGGSSGGSSHGGSGGGGGSAHGGFSAGRGGEFSGGHSNSYGNFAPQVRDIAQGGYRVLDTRPASVIAGTAIPNHVAHGPLVLGPAMGSAAKAALMTDDKRRVTGGAPPRHPHPPREGRRSGSLGCAQSGCDMPAELCLLWYDSDGDHHDLNTSLDCPPPRKLTPILYP